MEKKVKLEIRDLHMDYESNTPVVQGVSFQVYDGEFLSILGSSGCGKTTLLRMLIGILEPTSGQILRDGKDITHAHPSGRKMGIVFQNYALFENMSVFMNVAYAMKIRRVPNYKEKTRDILRRMELEELQDKSLQNFPAVSSSGSPSPGPWCCSRISSCSTSLCRPWMPPPVC